MIRALKSKHNFKIAVLMIILLMKKSITEQLHVMELDKIPCLSHTVIAVLRLRIKEIVAFCKQCDTVEDKQYEQ